MVASSRERDGGADDGVENVAHHHDAGGSENQLLALGWIDELWAGSILNYCGQSW
jgi:hypothetical protein